MEEFSQFAEYSVKKEANKHLLLYKILFALLSLLGSAFLCVALMTLIPIELSVILSIVAFIGLLIFSSYYLRTVEFDYRITNGELFFAEVYNGRTRVEKGSIIISRLEAIAPYKDKYKESAERTEYDNVYNFTSAEGSPYIYYAVNRDEENGSLDIYLFEPSEKMLKLLRFYNKRTVIL